MKMSSMHSSVIVILMECNSLLSSSGCFIYITHLAKGVVFPPFECTLYHYTVSLVMILSANFFAGCDIDKAQRIE